MNWSTFDLTVTDTIAHLVLDSPDDLSGSIPAIYDDLLPGSEL